MKYLDRVANIAVIVAVAIFLILVIRGEFPRRISPSTNRAAALVGKTISLPGVRFSTKNDTLLLGISESCHFCKESIPWYKQLTGQVQGKVDVIAVLPQTQVEAENFIRSEGLSGTKVVSANLGSIGVLATPTLLLVDSTGRVKDAWIGRQDEVGQQKVLAATLASDKLTIPRS
jgi:hypothetical protein